MTTRREIRKPLGSERRIGVALLFLAVVCSVAMLRYLVALAQVAAGPRSQQTFIALDRLFAEAVMPTSPDSRIGFFNGRPVYPDERADGNTAIFFLAQYAVAPRVMVAGVELPLVLVMLPSDQAVTRFCGERGRTVISHPAPGIALTRRAR